MKSFFSFLSATLLVGMFYTIPVWGQKVAIGPRLTGNLNIYNQKGLTGTWNGIGIGVGGTLDILFSSKLGIMVNITAFDMRNFSNSTTANNVTTENSLTLSYLVIDPMFKAEFSGFYMVGGPSLGIKLASGGELTQVAAGANPATQSLQFDTKSVRFDIVAGTGYSFSLSPGMSLGTDFMVYIPVSDTYNFPGLSNSVLTLKLGASLKFVL
ncbi:MAG: hypothetical protein Kow0098_04940 [Ignavibacteriaceae bacterium]